MRYLPLLSAFLCLALSAFAPAADASTIPLSYERIVSARCEIQVGPDDERIIDDDTLLMFEDGFLADTREASLAFGQSLTESSAFQTSLLSPDLFHVEGSISGFSHNDEDLFICQASPGSEAKYRFEVEEVTPYHFSGRLDATGGGAVVFRLDAAFGGENIFLEFAQGEEIVLDHAGELLPGTYDIRVSAEGYISPGDDQWASFSVQRSFGSTTGVPESAGGLPLRLAAAPNPFNPSVNVSFAMPSAGHAEVAVYDLQGRLARVLHSGPLGEGTQAFAWNGRLDSGQNAASGVYLVRAKGAGMAGITKITLSK